MDLTNLTDEELLMKWEELRRYLRAQFEYLQSEGISTFSCPDYNKANSLVVEMAEEAASRKDITKPAKPKWME